MGNTKVKYKDIIFEDSDKYNLEDLYLSEFLNYIAEFDLVISYELSKKTKCFFDTKGINYLDIWLSPYRFCKDIFFAFYSNNIKIQKSLQKYYIKKDILESASSEVKNYFNYENYNCKYVIEENSCLIVGQNFIDKAVFKDGNFLNLTDFYDDVLKLSKKYSKVYLTKHPQVSDVEFEKVVSFFSNIENLMYIEKVNIYYLISLSEIVCVAGISSSVLIEASFFQKEVCFFYKPVIDNNYVHVYKDFMKSSFWNDLLGLKKNNDINIMTFDNHLRYRMKAFYAYELFLNDFFSYERELRIHDRAFFLNRLNELDSLDSFVLYGYGSLGKIIYKLYSEKIIFIIDKVLIDSGVSNVFGKEVKSISKDISGKKVVVTPLSHCAEVIDTIKSLHGIPVVI
jgi:hypothetical protein